MKKNGKKNGHSKAKERASGNGKHCSYRHSTFLLVDFFLNALHGVTLFQQDQTVYTKISNSVY